MSNQQLFSSNRIQSKRPTSLLVSTSGKQIPLSHNESISQHQQQSPSKPNTTTHQQTNPKVQQLMNLFKSNQPQSRSYRETIEEIVSSFTIMDSLTNKLQQKVDHMLNNQKLQFIQSYKTHMNKVKQQFQSIDQKILQYEQKILYYQNQGEMSHLVIKVNQLQLQCQKLYKNLTNKQKVIRDNQLTIKVQKSEIKRYQKQLKLLMRLKNELSSKLELTNKNKINQINDKSINISRNQNHLENNLQQERQTTQKQIQSIKSTNQLIFPTQFQQISTNKKYNINTNRKSKEKSSLKMLNKRSQKSLTLDLSTQHQHLSQKLQNNLASPSQQSMIEQSITKTRENQLKKQILNLKKKNQILTSYQSHILDSNTSMESFFINCVNEIKQQIKIKKKTNSQITFEEWKKQDKIQLLIKVLSNEELLVYLYERLFKKGKTVKNEKQIQKFNNQRNNEGRMKGLNSLYELGGQKEIINRKMQQMQSKQKLLGLMKDKQIDIKQRKQKALSVAKKRVSKHISQNSLLPKIHFHLQY